MQKIFFVILVLFTTAVFTACESDPNDPNRPLTYVDFANLCAGQSLPRAAAYTPDTAPNQMMILTDNTIGAQYDEYTIRFTSNLPEEWFAQIVDGTFDYSPVELVTCIHRTSTTLADSCEFEDNYLLNVYDATYDVSIYAAQSGEKLTAETVSVTAECPSLHMFDEDEQEDDYYADLSEENLRTIIEPFMP